MDVHQLLWHHQSHAANCHSMKSAICLMGPTASGKTDLALFLAEKFHLEIINVDSAQIYYGLDIGSGKPDKKIRDNVTHHLMDFLDPSIAYSAAQFCQDASICIRDIWQRQRIPLLVGGTMLYFKALQEGLSSLPQADSAMRLQLAKRLEQEGVLALYEDLKQIDAVTAVRVQPTDQQRILRALEIYQLTGQPMSYWLSQPKVASLLPIQFINIGLMPQETDRKYLHLRIEQRFDRMLNEGFVDEVVRLLQCDDLNIAKPALRAVGYRQIIQYLSGEILSLNEMREKAIAATRQLAKRQLTWLRHWPTITPFDFLDPCLPQKVQEFLQIKKIPMA